MFLLVMNIQFDKKISRKKKEGRDGANVTFPSMFSTL